MKIIKKTSQSQVFNHWQKVEKINIYVRSDIISPLVEYADFTWSMARIEEKDLEDIYIISSDDWKSDGICVPDFKLITAVKNYNVSTKLVGKYADIYAKEEKFKSDINALDTRLILVTNNENDGPFTIIEGNRRSIALMNLNKLIGLEIYLGLSPAIKFYHWSRYSKKEK